jgi:hypothetical protein
LQWFAPRLPAVNGAAQATCRDGKIFRDIHEEP